MDRVLFFRVMLYLRVKHRPKLFFKGNESHKKKKSNSHTGKCMDKPPKYLWNDKKLPLYVEVFQHWLTLSETEKIQWCRFHWQLWLSTSCCPRTSLSSAWIRGYRCFLRWRSTCPRAEKDSLTLSHVKSNSTNKQTNKKFWWFRWWIWSHLISWFYFKLLGQTLTCVHWSWLSTGQQADHSQDHINRPHYGFL